MGALIVGLEEVAELAISPPTPAAPVLTAGFDEVVCVGDELDLGVEVDTGVAKLVAELETAAGVTMPPPFLEAGVLGKALVCGCEGYILPICDV